MAKWMLGALLSLTLLFGGALLSGMQTRVDTQEKILYEHSQDISTLKEAVKQWTETQKETRDAVKELSKDFRDAFLPPAKTNRR